MDEMVSCPLGVMEAWVQSKATWNLWLTVWHWDRFVSVLHFLMSVSFHQWSVLINWSLTSYSYKN